MKRVRRLSATLIVLVLAAIPLAASATAFAALPGGDGLSILTWVLAVVMGFLGLSAAFLKLLVQPTMAKMIADQRDEMSRVLRDTSAAFLTKLAEHETAAEVRWAHHHADPAAHPAGSSARIDPMRDALHALDLGQREMLAKLNTVAETLKQDADALAEIDARLSGLEREHCIMHGSFLKRRAADPPDVYPDSPRGGANG